jgi:UDP-N-acetylglucosamine enolpyruvyl transferase
VDKFLINGKRALKGTVEISGSKNAALPIMVATLLSPGKYIISNIPELRDVRTMAHLLRIIGAKIEFGNHETTPFQLTPPPLIFQKLHMNSLKQCVPQSTFWGHCWPDLNRPRFHCPEDVPGDRDQLTFISKA